MIQLTNLSRHFRSHLVFSAFDYRFDEHGLYLLIGDNGSGKSTLLNILSLLDDGYEGRLFFLGKDMKSISPLKKEKMRRDNICYLTSQHNLISFLNAKENREYNCRPRHHFDIIPDKEEVNHLSGGEEILLALSNAFSLEKKVYLLDEITSSLDERHCKEVMEVLKKMSEDHLIIMASHDPRLLKGRESRQKIEIIPLSPFFKVQQTAPF